MSKKMSFKRHQATMGYLFIAVPVLLLFLFMFIPVIIGFVLSFTNYDVVSRADFVGLSNYKRMFSDQYVWVSVRNTLEYAIMFVPLAFVTALGSALIINANKKGAKLFRTFFYVPVLCSSVATSVIWYWLLNPQYGLVNEFLGVFGINGPAWLYDTHWAMIAIVMMSVWMSFGTNMMIFLAGLYSIDDTLYEAAKLEKASWWQIFRYITFPLLKKTNFLVMTLLIIAAFQVFDQAFVLTEGGPGNSTITIVYYIYNQGFGSLNMGYASAMSFALFAVIFIFSFANNRITNKKEKD